jgi:hypothetical protein
LLLRKSPAPAYDRDGQGLEENDAGPDGQAGLMSSKSRAYFAPGGDSGRFLDGRGDSTGYRPTPSLSDHHFGNMSGEVKTFFDNWLLKFDLYKDLNGYSA